MNTGDDDDDKNKELKTPFWRRNLVSIVNICLVFSAFGAGLLFKHLVWPDGNIDHVLIRYLELPGKIYLRCLTLILTPLLITSMATSFIQKPGQYSTHVVPVGDERNVSEDDEEGQPREYNMNRVMGITFLLVFLFTTFTATCGTVAASYFQPGLLARNASELASIPVQDSMSVLKDHIKRRHTQVDSIYNILIQIEWPANLTTLEHGYHPPSRMETVQLFKPNLLGISLLSLLFGLYLQRCNPVDTVAIRNLLFEIQGIVFNVKDYLIKLLPYATFTWLFTESFKIKSWSAVVGQLAYFYLIAAGLMLTFWIILYPVVYIVLTRRNPLRLQTAIIPTMLTCLAFGSSSVALPVTIKCMEKGMRLPRSISRLVLPLTMNINMNGTSMYFGMLGVFVAQMKGVPQSIVSLIALIVFSVITSMSIPALPGAGIIFLTQLAFAAILGVDDPKEVIILALTFDLVIERMRTMTNVMGDCFVASCAEYYARRSSKPSSSSSSSQQLPKMVKVVNS